MWVGTLTFSLKGHDDRQNHVSGAFESVDWNVVLPGHLLEGLHVFSPLLLSVVLSLIATR